MAADVARRSRSAPLLALGQVRDQLLLLLRSPLGFFITLGMPLLLLISLNVITPPTASSVPGGLPYVQFLTPAVSAFCLHNACYVTTVTSMVLAREEGILKRLRGTPLPPWTYLGGRSGSALLTSLFSVGIIIGTAVLFFHVTIYWRAMGYFAASSALGLVCSGARAADHARQQAREGSQQRADRLGAGKAESLEIGFGKCSGVRRHQRDIQPITRKSLTGPFPHRRLCVVLRLNRYYGAFQSGQVTKGCGPGTSGRAHGNACVVQMIVAE